MRRLLFLLLTFLLIDFCNGQVYYVTNPFMLNKIGAAIVPEHGFLPGKKFPFYSTIDKYDLSTLKLRVEMFDERNSLNLQRINCSELKLTNTSEFKNSDCIYKVGQYFDKLLKESGASLDSTATDTLKINLQAIDARLIGFGYITVHGLCQMKIKYHNHFNIYCVDITDSDKHSPISPTAFVTRLTATRIIASASIREVIEQFFIDLKSYK